MYNGYYNSPIGYIEVKGTEEFITYVEFVETIGLSNENNIIKDCIRQLDEYFRGKRKEFDIKYNLDGTTFQNQVWNELNNIPYGKFVTYKDIAKAINNEKAVRAVGGANNKNKISIIIPCHRVIGATGKLIGYAGGIWRKEWLIKHEKSIMEV